VKPTTSIITPTYNRAEKVCRSIDSSLLLIDAGVANEIIVVDDASSDDTVSILANRYANQIAKNTIRIFIHNENKGVTSAKNTGIINSKSEWLIFMDSDDIFVKSTPSILLNMPSNIFNYDMLFFRCIDIENSRLIGQEMAGFEMDIAYFMNKGTPGECLPMIKTSSAKNNLYDPILRGCEGLTYLEMLKNGNTAFVSDKVIRAYDSSGSDRLSLPSQIKDRLKSMLIYHIRTLKFWNYANLFTNGKILLKITYYFCLIIINLIYKNKD
jgi:glycosyltransferase involved in cell wall biosynthesis